MYESMIIQLLLATTLATAPSDSPIIYGYGLQTCRAYVTARLKDDELDKLSFTAWLGGYLSAANDAGAKNLSLDEAEFWIEDFCFKNPEYRFKWATDAFVMEKLSR